MRVLVATGLYPPEIGGPATYSALLEAGLPSLGIEVTVVPFRKVSGYWKVARHVAYTWILIQSARNANVILATDPMSVGVPAAIAAFLLRKKFVIKVGGDYAWEQATQRFGFTGTLEEFQTAPVGMSANIFKTFQRFAARSATRIISPSVYLTKIVEQWGVLAEKISIIYNGVSVGEIGKRDIIRGVLHFDGSLIISVGRLVPWKGFDVLIKVCARLRKKIKNLKLFIVGSGPELARLEELTEKEGMTEQVIFAGAVDHDALMRYIKASDVFVLNTSYEGLSHLVLETMAVGVPVVTTTVGGNGEIVTDGVNGYLVKPNDMSALESRITALLEKPDLHTRFVKAGKVRAAEFSDARTLKETAELLQSL